MKDEELQDKVLETAYQAFERKGNEENPVVSMLDLAKKWGISKKQLLSNVKYLIERGLIEGAGAKGLPIRITDLGIDYIEGYPGGAEC